MSRDKERDPIGRAEWAYRFEELHDLDMNLVSDSLERIAHSRTLLERTETTDPARRSCCGTLPAARARRFCQALERAAAGRQTQWWTSIDAIARDLRISADDAIVLADDCAAAGLVRHDQSHTPRPIAGPASCRIVSA